MPYCMYQKSKKINDQTLIIPATVLNITLQILLYVQLSVGVYFGLKMFIFDTVTSNRRYRAFVSWE